MVETTGRKVYGKDFKLGKNWIKKFEKRWANRISKVKCSSISKHRGKKATAEVRDAVFANFMMFLRKLQQKGLMTEEQIRNLGDHLANCDEVGGNEQGKGKYLVVVFLLLN